MSSPPTSKRIKTSATTSAPPHLLAQQQIHPFHRVPTFEGIPIPSAPLPTQQNPGYSRKRPSSPATGSVMMASPVNPGVGAIDDPSALPTVESTPKKKGRTNTPWTAEEEQRLKTMRDAGRSWSEIAKDMHYAEFAEDESVKLREAIKEYEANKWKVIGQKVGKPAKACEQYAKEHFKNV
ncbi:unnamed protein product [Penicillium salamii]|uniref:HTH myb-type domain-containing protein n=1 Tax=Penicillium salamii TaxID=1612424 RepID=A0A9W4J0W5_9EURO|nr:unnamed protein product [Penicillium salamii]CAG8391011.1 unnamed protein product [Penicillium salamii]